MGAGAAGASTASLTGAHKAYKTRVEYSKLETGFRQNKKEFDHLREDTGKLHAIADHVQSSSHSSNVKVDLRCCCTRELPQLPKILTKLCKTLRSVDFQMERNKVEELISELRMAY